MDYVDQVLVVIVVLLFVGVGIEEVVVQVVVCYFVVEVQGVVVGYVGCWLCQLGVYLGYEVGFGQFLFGQLLGSDVGDQVSYRMGQDIVVGMVIQVYWFVDFVQCFVCVDFGDL